MQTSGNTILITGGGSGIGRELAHKWHDLGNTVIVAGRTQASLDETAAGHANIHTMIVDVGDADDLARFAKKVVEVHPAINVLVNNAGIMRFEDITEERELGDAEATIATNLLGPIRLIDGLIASEGTGERGDHQCDVGTRLRADAAHGDIFGNQGRHAQLYGVAARQARG